MITLRTPEFEPNQVDFSIDGIKFTALNDGDHTRALTESDRVVLLKGWPFVEAELREIENLDISAMVEFGVWRGGSSVLWPLITNLDRYVGIDIQKLDVKWPPAVTSHPRWKAIRLYGEVSQDDRVKLDSILNTEFKRPLDLVIDDASHQYLPSRATFEICFPKLRAGGVYILEDWAWAHWAGDWQQPDHHWAGSPALSNLVFELTMASASRPDIIPQIKIMRGFVVVSRGPAALDESFSLDGVTLTRGRRLQPI
jgi:hypothetical protein